MGVSRYARSGVGVFENLKTSSIDEGAPGGGGRSRFRFVHYGGSGADLPAKSDRPKDGGVGAEYE
jgi:hypothetical protein